MPIEITEQAYEDMKEGFLRIIDDICKKNKNKIFNLLILDNDDYQTLNQSYSFCYRRNKILEREIKQLKEKS